MFVWLDLATLFATTAIKQAIFLEIDVVIFAIRAQTEV